MLALKVPKLEGEKIKRILVKEGLLLREYKVKRDKTSVYFPVKKGIPGYSCVEMSFEKRAQPKSLQKFGIKSFDTIGDIAVVDIPEELKDKKEAIAQALLTRKPISTVVQKCSRVCGEFRTRMFEHVAGELKTETLHREYGLTFALDINEVYFNPRLARERLRIARAVSQGEVITDMFCGVGPFSLMISKFSKAETIYAIDINPKAICYLRENIKINRIHNVIPILGDAKEEIRKIGCTDRIIMNLPHKSFEFLCEALQYGKIIHYYSICADIEEEKEKIMSLAADLEIPIRIAGWSSVKSYSPDMDMYRIDIAVNL